MIPPIPPLLMLGALGLAAGAIIASFVPKKDKPETATPELPGAEKKKPLPPPKHKVDEINPPGGKKRIELNLPKDPPTDPPTDPKEDGKEDGKDQGGDDDAGSVS